MHGRKREAADVVVPEAERVERLTKVQKYRGAVKLVLAHREQHRQRWEAWRAMHKQQHEQHEQEQHEQQQQQQEPQPQQPESVNAPLPYLTSSSSSSSSSRPRPLAQLVVVPRLPSVARADGDQLWSALEADYALVGKIIELNPEFSSLWNFRRELYLSLIQRSSSSAVTQDAALVAKLTQDELDLAERGLRKNPKCYGAWFHRLWVVDVADVDVQRELDLCTKMLQLDSRNFHCWNYRRAIALRAQVPLESEFEFTTTKIHENFSNFSAWHYRSFLLLRMHKVDASSSDARIPTSVLDKEFELIKNAFIDPHDQSGWMYHRWLLGQVLSHGPPVRALAMSLSFGGADTSSLETVEAAVHASWSRSVREYQRGVFERELAMCRELVEIEVELNRTNAAAAAAAARLHSDAKEADTVVLSSLTCTCKWILLTIALLLAGIEAIEADLAAHKEEEQDSATATAATAIAKSTAASASRITELTTLLTTTLPALDPMRRTYYLDVAHHVESSAPPSVC